MAAATWDRSPGAGPVRDANSGSSLYASSLKALEDLAAAIPGFLTRLQSKEQLDARQRILAQNGGSIEQTGTSGDQVQLRVSERVGEGTFCVVFRAELLSDKSGEVKNKPVAAKFSANSTKELRKNDSTQLRNEFRMYKKLDGCSGIAKIYAFGEMDFHKVLVMDLLGPSLESIFQDCTRHFSIKTVAMLAKQMISRIQLLHEHGLIYRDIKPENFLMGLPGSDTADMVYLIDYGMAKMYRDPDTRQHIPYGEAQSLSGTARYMSINAHCRRSQSRRDDLEALGYVFLYFLRGSLPWQGVKVSQNGQRYDQMCEKKQATTIEDLCRGFPAEFAQYLTYTRGLAFDGDPDYDYLKGLFTQILSDQGAVDDSIYDWIKPIQMEEEAKDDGASGIAASSNLAVKPDPAVSLPPSLPMPTDTSLPGNISERSKPRRPTTPPQMAGVPQDTTIARTSPPGGKRRRSEFSSELHPPVRVRPKKSKRVFYNSEAQRDLVTLYRDVMAKCYAFHRAVKQNRNIRFSASPATTARDGASPGIYSRSVVPVHTTGSSVISTPFTTTLDKTLGKVISELEEMSDKLLQDGDWSGSSRVHDWLEEVAVAVRQEIERLHTTQKEEEEKRRQQEIATESKDIEAGNQKAPETPPNLLSPLQILGQGEPVNPSSTSVRSGVPTTSKRHEGIEAANSLEVDDGEEDDYNLQEMKLRARYGRGGSSGLGHSAAYSRQSYVPASGAASRPSAEASASKLVAGSAPSATSAATPVNTYSSWASPSAVVRSGMDQLSLTANTGDALEVDDTIGAADDVGNGKIDADDGDPDNNEITELVYRTASGTRKVMRISDNST